MDEQKKLVHEFAMDVRWVDMDAFGHVNTSVYFTYFEQARVDWWMQIDTSQLDLLTTGPVVVDARCLFIKSILYPETILVKVYVGPAGRSSYKTYYQIYSRQHPDILYAEGEATMVWVDRKAGRSTPLPDVIRRHLPEKV